MANRRKDDIKRGNHLHLPPGCSSTLSQSSPENLGASLPPKSGCRFGQIGIRLKKMGGLISMGSLTNDGVNSFDPLGEAGGNSSGTGVARPPIRTVPGDYANPNGRPMFPVRPPRPRRPPTPVRLPPRCGSISIPVAGRAMVREVRRQEGRMEDNLALEEEPLWNWPVPPPALPAPASQLPVSGSDRNAPPPITIPLGQQKFKPTPCDLRQG